MCREAVSLHQPSAWASFPYFPRAPRSLGCLLSATDAGQPHEPLPQVVIGDDDITSEPTCYEPPGPNCGVDDFVPVKAGDPTHLTGPVAAQLKGFGGKGIRWVHFARLPHQAA